MKRWIFALAVLWLPTMVHAQVNALPAAPHLLVKGHAENRYMPDRFTISVVVDVTDLNPGKARQKVDKHMQALIVALKSCGAMPDRTHATSFLIKPDTDYQDGKKKFLGTEVTRSIDATFDSVDKLRRFIAMVPADKEVQISDTDVARSDIDAIRQKLRMQAIENSNEAAQRIASAYGMKLKGVYGVSEVAPSFSYGLQAGTYGGQELGSVQVSANSLGGPEIKVGTIKVEQDIYAVYLVEP